MKLKVLLGILLITFSLGAWEKDGVPIATGEDNQTEPKIVSPVSTRKQIRFEIRPGITALPSRSFEPDFLLPSAGFSISYQINNNLFPYAYIDYFWQYKPLSGIRNLKGIDVIIGIGYRNLNQQPFRSFFTIGGELFHAQGDVKWLWGEWQNFNQNGYGISWQLGAEYTLFKRFGLSLGIKIGVLNNWWITYGLVTSINYCIEIPK